MNFKAYLQQQLALHPSMQPQDVVKLCYQAAHGAEHLLSDIKAAEKYFYQELEAVAPAAGDLYEPISPEICRVNFAAWKASGMPPEWLFYMFTHSVCPLQIGEQVLPEYLEIAAGILQSAEFDAYVKDYKVKGMPAVHHSEDYRTAEQPHYRIVSRFFMCVLPILERISALPKTDRAKVIALDGRAAAGKTTAAGYLADILGGAVVHMDDFFLPPALRSAERFATPGANVHYERFSEEVLPDLRGREPFFYCIFDCGRMEFHGERRVDASPYRIVEGAYSQHPAFGDYADLRVFVDVDPDTQIERILVRNGEEMAKMFRERWIPMEEAYFAHYLVRERADLVLKM